MAAEATALVAGLDIHPVAVIIARVTYLLALAPALQARKGTISIPVYLGDALQLSISDTMGRKELTMRDGAPGMPGAKARREARFPGTVLPRSGAVRPGDGRPAVRIGKRADARPGRGAL